MTDHFPVFIRRDFADGAYLEIGNVERTLWIMMRDACGDHALHHFTPEQAARHRDDISRALLARSPTLVQLNADILARSFAIALQRLDDLKKTDPANVVRLYLMLVAHIRSSCAEALRGGL